MSNLVQTMLARTGLGSMLGLQMNGKRDLYNVYGWSARPTHQDFVRKYQRQDIARRVINAPVNALWSDPPQVSGDPTFLEDWQNLLAKIPVFASLQKLDKLCGLGQFAVLVVGYDDARTLETPLAPVADGNKRKVIYLQPYAEGSVAISEYEKDPRNPRFGLPLMYTISPGSFDTITGIGTTANISQRGPSFKVHYSRVLHVAEEALESPVFGRSRLECVYNVLDDILKVSGGSAEVYWLNANRGLHVDIDKDMEIDPKDAAALSDELDEYSNQLRRVIRTRGVKVNSLGADVLDPRGVFDVQMSLLASATGIPKRVLAGSEAGQLASQQDRANWSLRVEERISEYGNPVVLIPFLRMLIDAGVLSVPSQMTIQWPDAFKMNPLERAQTSAQMARSAANLAKTLLTVQQINHANAVDSQPTVTPIGGGGFFGNADSLPAPKKKDSAVPPSSGDTSQSKQQATIETPPLFSKTPPTLVLLTEEECRSIIGFGKHMPVFDDKQDSISAVGDGAG